MNFEMQSLESLGYEVIFDSTLQAVSDFINSRSYSKIVILVDNNTQEMCLPILQTILSGIDNYDVIEIDAGEENKTIDYCIGVWQTLLDFEIDRNALMINLGGGVVTDLGGFVASTYKRGIDFVQIPTTVLSQVDASVGGKTGIDLHNLKNVVGTFTQPQAVFISTKFLETLDPRQQLSGLAEIIKHGLIFDKQIYEDIKGIHLRDIDQQLIYRSVVVKNKVIVQDPTEKGLRKILNFGHTIGHAIEAYSLTEGNKSLLHGEAIAVGMICEAYLSYKLNGLPIDQLQDISRTLLTLYPAFDFDNECYKTLLDSMKNDKKNQEDKIGFSLLKEIGVCDYNIYVDISDIFESLDYYRQQVK